MQRHSRLLLCLFAAAACAASACYDTAVLDAKPATNVSEPECQPACTGDERCHPDLHVCVNCADLDDCSDEQPEMPVCDPQHAQCPPCHDSAECGDAGAVCIGGVCFSCRDDRDCPFGQHCDRSGGQFVQRCIDDNRGPGNGGH